MQKCTRPILSLFCGAGGLDVGFRDAGFSPLLAVDADDAAVATYRRNHASTRVEQLDVASLSVDKLVDLWKTVSVVPPLGVLGGPPCQYFSKSNRSIKPDDPRRRLPEHYARLIRGLNQRSPVHFFVFENVAGLRAKPHLDDLKAFRQLFTDAGFRLFESVLDAQYFGVPQKRARLLIVGLNASIYRNCEFEFPSPGLLMQPRTVRTAIHGLPEPAQFRRGLDSTDIPVHPNHWTMVPRSPKFQDPNLRTNWSRGRSFRVLNWDAPSWTVAYGHREVHVHPDGHRRLSVFEAMRLQGFPDTYILEGTLSDQIRLVGDAVPPPMAHALATALSKYLAFSQNLARDAVATVA